MLKEKAKRRNLSSASFSFFFLFKFCGRRKRKKQRTDSQTESFDQDGIACDSLEMNTKNVISMTPNNHKQIRNPNKQDNSQSTKKSPQKFLQNNAISVNSKTKSPSKFSSPLKKRHIFSSPAKNAPLNSHVTVELSNFDDAGNSTETIQSRKASEDKCPLIDSAIPCGYEPFEMRSPVPTFESFGKESPQKVQVKNSSSFRQSCVTQDVKTQGMYSLPRKKRSPANAKILMPLGSISPSKLFKDHCWNSFGDVSDKSDEKVYVKNTQLSLRRYYQKKSELNSDTKSKSLADINSNQQETDANVCKKIAETCQMPEDSERAKRRQNELPKTSFTRQINELASTDKQVTLRHQKSRSNQRPRSTIDLKDSDYVLLNPISGNSRKEHSDSIASPRHSARRKELFKTDSLPPAKSFDSLYYSNRNTMPITDATSPNIVSPKLSESENELFKSPGVDYRSEIERVLAELHKSLRKEENIVKDWTNYGWDQSFVTAGFPMKKSKSVEPITAQTRIGAKTAPYTDCNRNVATSRSRSRVRHIAKKYNMYNSNENVSTMYRSPHQDPPVPTRTNFGFGNYVYLNQLPNPASPIGMSHQINHTRTNPTTPSACRSNDSVRNRCFTPGIHSPSEHADGDILLTSRTGDYYHLDVFVENNRPVPDGAESHFDYESPSSNNKSLYCKDIRNRPHIFYSLDV